MMLERLHFMRARSRLKGKAAGVAVGGRCMPCRIVDANLTGLQVSDVEDNTVLIPWSRVEYIKFGPACEDDLGRRKHAWARAKARFAELRAADDKTPGLPREEIEALLRQFEGSPQ